MRSILRESAGIFTLPAPEGVILSENSEASTERVERFFASLRRPVSLAGQWLGILILCFLVLAVFSATLLWLFSDRLQKASVKWGPTFLAQPWADAYRDEWLESNVAHYVPYVGFRRTPNYTGRYINLDEASNRHTENPCSGPDAERIFMFGGSTLWGTGARDAYTIPSHLSAQLCAQGRAVAITNYGETGYTTNEETVQLIQELKRGQVPAMVIFYDGINDVGSSYQQGEAGNPQNVENRIIEFNARYNPIWESFFGQIKTYRVIRSGLRRSGILRPPSHFLPEDLHAPLARETSRVYFNNLRVVRALGQEYGFRSLYFWQPVVYTKAHRTSEEEQYVEQGIGVFMEHGYSVVREEIARHPERSVVDLSGIFDDQTGTIFIDWMHVNERGNELIARAMTQAVLPLLRPRSLGAWDPPGPSRGIRPGRRDRQPAQRRASVIYFPATAARDQGGNRGLTKDQPGAVAQPRSTSNGTTPYSDLSHRSH